MIKTANKISIIGGSGTGKTTLAENLGKKLNLPVCHIDGIHHLPNWQIRDKDERDKIMQKIVLLGVSRKLFIHSLPLLAIEKCYMET